MNNYCEHWKKPSFKLFILSKIKYEKYKWIYTCRQCGIGYKEGFYSTLIYISAIILSIDIIDSFTKPYIPKTAYRILIILLIEIVLYIPLETLHYLYVKFERK